MKHSLKITLYLIILFLSSQFIGLAVISKYIDTRTTTTTGEVTFESLPYNIERPPSEDYGTTLYIVIGVIIGTILMLLIIKYQKKLLWKLWFFIAVIVCLSIALSAYIWSWLAFIISVLLGYFKVFRANLWVHNITEVVIYGGIAAVFVPILNVPSVLVLLLIISAYDMVAVWYSRHMVKLAEFQKGNKVFAGVMLPSAASPPKKIRIKRKIDSEPTYAILGGGDIAFPLLFAGVVMKGLVLDYSIWGGFIRALPVTAGAATALIFLFVYAKKDRYYPAMPFLTVGCLLGWVVTFLF